MILITSTVSSFKVEKTAQRLALLEENVSTGHENAEGKILISLAYPETVAELVDFGMMLKSRHSTVPVYALNIISDESEDNKTRSVAKKVMEKAVRHAAATEQTLIPLTRYDVNISNGIIYTLKEQNITDLLIGLHQGANQHDFLGPVAERILKHTSETVFIYKSVQPFNTLKRMIVAVTPKAELEPGFAHWFSKLTNIAKEAGIGIDFYATRETLKELKDQQMTQRIEVKILHTEFQNWDDFLVFCREVRKNDLFVIISSRKGHVSFQPTLEKLPYYLSNYFTANSFIMLFPQQVERGIKMNDVQFVDSTLAETITDKVAQVGRAGIIWKHLFRKRT
jgi:hypothetical protein